MSYLEIMEILRTLARSKTRFITVRDLCEALRMQEEDCISLLQQFVEQGLLRPTQSSRGESYFWLTPQLSQE